jgi:hypothetical protein
MQNLHFPSVRGLQFRLSPLHDVLNGRVFRHGGVVL